MFFALTDDQRAFAAAVRSFLAERFDLDAVRGVVEDPAATATRRRSGRPRRAGLARRPRPRGARRPRARPARRAGHRPRARARASRPGRGGAPCSPPRRSGWRARPSSRRPGCRGSPRATVGRRVRRDARARRPGALAAPSSTRASPTSSSRRRADGLGAGRRGASGHPRAATYDGTVAAGRPSTGGRRPRRCPARRRGRAPTLRPRAAVLTAADLVGVAREALTRTVAYDRDRKQFGVPVGSFQAIKHDAGRPARRGDDGRARRAVRRPRGGRRRRRTPDARGRRRQGQGRATPRWPPPPR